MLSQLTYKEYLKVTIPFMLSTATQPLLGAVNTAVMGHMSEAFYIAAVSLGVILFNNIYWLFGFLRVSTTSFSAQALGSESAKDKFLALARPLLIAIVISLIFLIIYPWIFKYYALLMKPESQVVELMKNYCDIIIWGAPFVLINYVTLGWLMGQMIIRYTMFMQISMNVLNIVLSIVFVFIMDMNLYLYEHQSTYNPNMPLRDLFYICSEYQKLVDKKSLYSSTLQKIPAPNFIEFYNGSTAAPDCTELRLSSAFECLTGEPKLELIVTVLNVNEGHNADLMQHCSMLKEYAQYVARVRHYATDMPLNQAVERAVDECIQKGILTEFLTRNRNEVISMSIFEYDKELEEKKLRKAEYEYGFSEGKKTGFQNAAMETARRMLKSNKLSLEDIADFSGLSIDEIKQLQNTKS